VVTVSVIRGVDPTVPIVPMEINQTLAVLLFA